MSGIAGAERLVTAKIYITLFVALLATVTSQASLRTSLLELPLHVLGWGILLALGLTAGWVAARGHRDGDQGMQNLVAWIGISVFIYQSMTSSMDVALCLLLVWLLIAMSIRLTNRRTLYFVLLASFCLILYAASLSKDSVFLIYLLIYVLAIVITLILDYSNARIHHSLVSDDQQQTAIPVFRTGLIIGLPIVLLTTGMYLLIPRPPAAHYGFFSAGGDHYYHNGSWLKQAKNKDINTNEDSNSDPLGMNNLSDVTNSSSQPDNQESLHDSDHQSGNDQQENHDNFRQATDDSDTVGAPGFSQGFSLNDQLRPDISNGNSGNSISNDIVLYMQGSRGQYLRGAVFDQFDGKSWHTTDQRTIKRRLAHGNLVLRQTQPGTQLNQYTITMRKALTGKALIVIPPGSVELRFPGSVIAEDSYGTLYSPKRIQPNTIYSVHIPAKTRPGRPYIEQTTEPDKTTYLQLPEQLPARIIALSNRLSANIPSTLDKALAMEHYLRNNFRFSYQTILSQNKIPLDEFLFETKYGHCEYFATALTILLRAQDIPARLVTGYSVTTFNPITGYYEARVLDGHAWVEAWIAGTGWITFEPTTAYTLPKETSPVDPAQAMQDYYEKLSKTANQLAPGSAEAELYATLQWFFEQFNLIVHATWQAVMTVIIGLGSFLALNSWWMFITGLFGYLACYYLNYRIRVLLACSRVKRYPESNPVQLLSHCYNEVEVLLSHYGYPRDPSWTLRQYRREIIRAFPKLETNFTTICYAYNTLRYSPQIPNNSVYTGIPAHTIKSATLEILKHPFPTPIPARQIIHPVLILIGRA
ncbi:MAG: transglutaminaseTgpA domain-containing protein [Methylococcales bacterium]